MLRAVVTLCPALLLDVLMLPCVDPKLNEEFKVKTFGGAIGPPMH